MLQSLFFLPVSSFFFTSTLALELFLSHSQQRHSSATIYRLEREQEEEERRGEMVDENHGDAAINHPTA
jgi:cell division protein FtsI/penicillin-binding protein 2